MSHLLVRSTPPTAQPQGQPPTPSLASPHSPLAPFQSQLHPAATGNLKKQDGSHCSAEAFAGNPSTFTERPNSTAEPESGPHVCLVVLRPSCFLLCIQGLDCWNPRPLPPVSWWDDFMEHLPLESGTPCPSHSLAFNKEYKPFKPVRHQPGAEEGKGTRREQSQLRRWEMLVGRAPDSSPA